MQSEQKSEEKATMTKLPNVSPPASDEKGETKNLYMYFSMERSKFYGTRDSFTEVNGFILPPCSKRCHKKIKILYLCDL